MDGGAGGGRGCFNERTLGVPPTSKQTRDVELTRCLVGDGGAKHRRQS